MSDTRSRLGWHPTAIAVLVILTTIVLAFIGQVLGKGGRGQTLVNTPSTRSAAPTQMPLDPPMKKRLRSTTCTTVRIIASQPRTSYSQYASTLAKLINDPALNGGNGWRASPDSDTNGTSQNLKNLGVPENQHCTLAPAQLNVVVDAQNGRGDFTDGAVEGLGTVIK
ncbi:hypothetical protein [Frankia sp. CcWB2]